MTGTAFDTVIILDWSAAARPAKGKDSIWIGQAGAGACPPANPSTRAAAMAEVADRIARARAAGHRVLIGADFPFAFPRGFARALTGREGALAVWDWLVDHIEDGVDNANNRFVLADRINAAMPGIGPFWGRPSKVDLSHLPTHGSRRSGSPFPEHRAVETLERGTQPVWKLYTTGSVGSQALLGIARLAALRSALGPACAVWPLEPAVGADVVLVEVWPSLLAAEVRAAEGSYSCRDAAQVDLLSRALAGLSSADLAALMAPPLPAADLAEEGWILGAGQAAVLRAALAADLPALVPPRLHSGCFALPQGVGWVPVDDALSRLRETLTPLATAERLPVARAGGRVLAEEAIARRANPPAANSAVDGYGFAHAALTGPGPQTLPLAPGRAAAGQPFAGTLPRDQAVRILTGALLPPGVDTVVLEEDCATDGARVAFDGAVKPRANTRPAGEDVGAGQTVLPAGRRLTPADLALLSALGIAEVAVFRPLRVAVLSTGDEILPDPAAPAALHQIYDANRPMLLDLARRWGFQPVDLGHALDDPRRIAARLDRGARTADVILTSGGASAGDEDHISHLLRDHGHLSSWRIAMKPGRPLALALWQGVPVLGLPGNPVAAFVCALVFGYPALSLLAGGTWAEPSGYPVPAAFTKHKKAGRREYLRARLDAEGRAEVFASEGSGRISGLSWATGLVELPDAEVNVTPGTPVRFLPFGSFGL